MPGRHQPEMLLAWQDPVDDRLDEHRQPGGPDRVDHHADDRPDEAGAVRSRVGEEPCDRSVWRSRTGCGGVAPGMRPVPRPRRADDRFEIREPRHPAQPGLRLLRRREQHGGIAGTPRADRPRHVEPGHALHRVDDLPDGVRTAGAEVVRVGPAGLDQCMRAPSHGRRRDRRRGCSRAGTCRRASGSRSPNTSSPGPPVAAWIARGIR